MSNFLGFVNLHEQIENKKEILEKMVKANNKIINLSSYCFYIDKSIAFCSNNTKGSKNQPYMASFQLNNYIILFDGILYNTEYLKNKLIFNNFESESNSSVEILLKLYILYGSDILNYIEGSFSFIIFDFSDNSLFIARDHLGLKPLYYTLYRNTFVFASNIKSLLSFPGIDKILDEKGAMELLGLGPLHSPGTTYFKNIYELKPAHYGILNSSGLTTKRYWNLENIQHKDTFPETRFHIRNILNNSVLNQLTDTSCRKTIFLSNNLESHILLKHLSDYYKDVVKNTFNVYSTSIIPNSSISKFSRFEPVDSIPNFPSLDKVNTFSYNNLYLSSNELINSLYSSLFANDSPCINCLDSYYIACKYIKKEKNAILSTIGLNEIFAGYSGLFTPSLINKNFFPWNNRYNLQSNLINPKLNKSFFIRDYIKDKYTTTLSEFNFSSSNHSSNMYLQKLYFLNLFYYMYELIQKSSNFSKYYNIDIRLPFCNYKLLEYIWNIPWDWKLLNNNDKGLLRYTYKHSLSSKIIDSTENNISNFEDSYCYSTLKTLLEKTLRDINSPLYQIMNIDYLNFLLESDCKSIKNSIGTNFLNPSQLLAYIYQINIWIEKYNIKIDL